MAREIRGPAPGLACGRTDEKERRGEGDKSDRVGQVDSG